MNIVLLDNHLEPLHPYLVQDDVSEISINRPGEIWIERRGKLFQETLPELTLTHLKDLAKLVATFTEQVIDEAHPLLSAHLPEGYRIQIAYPPIVSEGTIGMSIRKSSIMDLSLEKYNIDEKTLLSYEGKDHLSNTKEDLRRLHEQKHYTDFLKLAIKHKLNILISGGTSTGKTTFLNALLKEVPKEERIITIEDVPEIHLTQPNVLSLFASRNEQGRAKVDMQHLVEASLRLRPDRIIIGELRGSEAFSFLRAVNTGHPGSVATLHADTPLLALEQLILMVMQKNLGLKREQIENYINMVMDIIVQLKKGKDGIRYISEIYYNPFV